MAGDIPRGWIEGHQGGSPGWAARGAVHCQDVSKILQTINPTRMTGGHHSAWGQRVAVHES